MRKPEKRNAFFNDKSALHCFFSIKQSAKENKHSFSEELQREIEKEQVTGVKYRALVTGMIKPKAEIEKLLIWAKNNLQVQEEMNCEAPAAKHPGLTS